MRTALALLITASSLAFAAPAFAGCSDSISTKVASGYTYTDFALAASIQPVVQSSYARTCGKWTGGAWTSFGNEGHAANEIDGFVTYDTKLGEVNVEASAQYFALDLDNHSFGSSRDDMAEVYVSVSRPFKTSDHVTVTPLFKVIKVVGIGDLKDATVIQPGIAFSLKATSRTTMDLDVRETANLTQHYAAFRWSASVSHSFTNQLSGQVGVLDTSRTQPVGWVSLNWKW